MKYSIEFEIAGLPKMITNGSQGSWRAKAGNARLWKSNVMTALIGIQGPSARLQCAKCTFIRFSSAEPDDDNLRASFKPVRDGLVLAGILVNDRPQNMPDPIYKWQKCKQKEGHIYVKVEEILKEESVATEGLLVCE